MQKTDEMQDMEKVARRRIWQYGDESQRLHNAADRSFLETKLNKIMRGKALLIPLAAFAVTVGTAQAFNPEVLERAGLSNEQISAFEEAHELRKAGDRDAARDVIAEAGIDEEVMENIREAMKEWRADHREAIKEAVENEDYEAFLAAVEGSPLADIITTEADFALFVEAHELRESGDREGAKAIFDELGIEKKRHHGPFGHLKNRILEQLTDEQKEALREAHADGDREAVKEILEEAGIKLPERGG